MVGSIFNSACMILFQTPFHQALLMCQDTDGSMSHVPVSYLGSTAMDTVGQTGAAVNPFNFGYSVGFSSLLGAVGAPPPTHYAARRYTHRKTLTWNGTQNMRAITSFSDNKQMKSGTHIRLSSAKVKVDQSKCTICNLMHIASLIASYHSLTVLQHIDR